MRYTGKVLLLIGFLLAALASLTPVTPAPVAANDSPIYLPLIKRGTTVCLSAQETELANSINAYRVNNGLSSITVSVSLVQVAHAHVQDLHQNKPHEQAGCNLHSWSDQGTWTPVCYTDDQSQARDMWNKPREITNGVYSDSGIELAYSASEQASAADAFNAWQNSPDHNEVILEEGLWAGAQWLAMGVGIYENYAVLWLGASPDSAGTAGQCQ
jgi:uncharacterized protein YkwD